MQKELQSQQSNISSTQENLNSLCRKYHSAELERLGGAMTGLTKKHEAASQLCSRTQASLQESLEKHFHGELPQAFAWIVWLQEGIQTKCRIETASKCLQNFPEEYQVKFSWALRFGQWQRHACALTMSNTLPSRGGRNVLFRIASRFSA